MATTQKTRYCDNHPDVQAWVITDLDGAIAEIALCETCTPPHLMRYADSV